MVNVKYTVIELNLYLMVHSIELKFEKIWLSGTLAIFLLENRDFLGFRMIFKVVLNQIFSNFNTMLWTIKYRLSSITVYFTFTVAELVHSIVLKFENIWLSGTLNIIRKPKKIPIL
jgi:hypothetical protein